MKKEGKTSGHLWLLVDSVRRVDQEPWRFGEKIRAPDQALSALRTCYSSTSYAEIDMRGWTPSRYVVLSFDCP